QKPWIVETKAPSVARAASRSPSSRKRARRRSRSSPAALSVKVMARIRAGSMPSSRTARTKRSTSTDVLPLPALAESSSERGRPAIAVDHVEAGVGVLGDQPATAQVGHAERLVEGPGGLEPEQVARGAQVQRGLERALGLPLLAGRHAPALVVDDDGAVAGGA